MTKIKAGKPEYHEGFIDGFFHSMTKEEQLRIESVPPGTPCTLPPYFLYKLKKRNRPKK